MAVSADPEYVGGLLAMLRAEHPDMPLHVLAEMIDWPNTRRFDEPYLAYAERTLDCPLEPL